MITICTIYNRPTDYPNKFVVRKWFAGAGAPQPETTPLLVADDVAECRQLLQQNGLTKVGRYWGDDPVILENWI